MIEKYQNNFASLSAVEAALVAGHLSRRLPEFFTPEQGGLVMYHTCQANGIGQADVVLACARDPSVEAVMALEKLIGKPIERAPYAASTAPRPAGTPRRERSSAAPSGAAIRRSDPRKIAWVGDNPKKPGSSSHARFALYQVGMSVDEFVKAGGTTADVKWDTERGFVKLEES